jgi:hypothetical protein
LAKTELKKRCGLGHVLEDSPALGDPTGLVESLAGQTLSAADVILDQCLEEEVGWWRRDVGFAVVLL